MHTSTNKFLTNYALLLLLITAFLAMQWTTIHIHLSEQHDHDGSYHQHQIETHSHHLTSQYTDTSDFSHQTSHEDAVDLNYHYTLTKKLTQKKTFAYVVSAVTYRLPSFLLVSIKTSAITNTKLSYFSYLTFNPRAPPLTS